MLSEAAHKALRASVTESGLLSWDQLVAFLSDNEPALHEVAVNVAAGKLSWNCVKKLSKTFRYLNEAEIYPNLIKALDPEIKLLDLDGRQFIGSGYGMGSLDSYRIGVRRDTGAPVFEKIYNVKKDDFTRNLWFYNTVLPQISIAARVPALNYTTEGGTLGAIYQDQLHSHSSINREGLRELLPSLLREFAQFRAVPTDPRLLIFGKEYIFSSGLDRLIASINNSPDLTRMVHEALALVSKKAYPRCFAHGDIDIINVSDAGEIYDFDRCGLYPIGYDLAFYLSKNVSPKSVQTVDSFISEAYLYPTPAIRHTVYIFSAIFYSRRQSRNVDQGLIYELLYQSNQVQPMVLKEI